MKRIGRAFLVVLLLGALLTPAQAAAPDDFKQQTSVGVKAAESLSQVTGVAISPLLGIGALGAFQYFRAKPEERSRLPWNAQPWFFGAALLVVAICMAKDAAGPAVPTALKKPLDVLEFFENKGSALLATGIIVPLVMEVFAQSKPHLSSQMDLAGLHFAAMNLAWLGDLVAIPVALLVFGIVWLVSHTINVLILISPFTTVDAALKAFRAAVLGSVVVTGVLDPRLGAVWSLGVILACALLAPWAFRTVTFGTVFAWDILSFRQNRFIPSTQGNWMFTAGKLGQAPHRAYGRLHRMASGELHFTWRPWLVLPARTEVLPPGRYILGKGLIHSEILRVEGDCAPDVFNLPPRCNGHEAALAELYGFAEVRPVGLRAAWAWLKELFAGKPELVAAP